MTRSELILKTLNEMNTEEGASASEISRVTRISRENVSRVLNQLHKEGKVAKKQGRTVKFIPVMPSLDETKLDRFAALNKSLKPLVDQAKGAVLYPPNGIPTLLLGETGVGKSMFAKLIFEFAKETGRMKDDAPFVVFNCADYAHTPQLLLSQLFGTKKGAYTGADEHKPGLLEKADGGILFLDEVHRLPPEGQEMFFTFIDEGVFRRLGETEQERTANVFIISATTENPDSALLTTFTRRIPAVLRLPPLRERTPEERYYLIKTLFTEESARLKQTIRVSLNSIRAFLSYDCPNNIGQLKTDIQMACVKAYTDFLTHKKDVISVDIVDLPDYAASGLYTQAENRNIWTTLKNVKKNYYYFSKDQAANIVEEEAEEENIYEIVDEKMGRLKLLNLDSTEIEKEMERDIEDYFSKLIHHSQHKSNLASLGNIVDAKVLSAAREIIRYSESALDKKWSEKVQTGLIVHLNNSVLRFQRGQKIQNTKINKIRTQYSREFNTALECVEMFNRMLDLSLPLDEAGFLTMFFIYDEQKKFSVKDEVKIIVLAHGNSTASGMAETVNQLLGVNHVIGINAPLDEKPQAVLERLKNWLREADIQTEILFLVDMGSLATFGVQIEKELNIKNKTLPLVSTLHVLEAARKAVIGYSLEEIYEETLKVNAMIPLVKPEAEAPSPVQETTSKPPAILTLCLTGEGTAVAMRQLLQSQLESEKNGLAIIPVNILEKESIPKKIDDLERKYSLICAVSAFKIERELPQFDIYEVINGTAIPAIRELVQDEQLYLQMEETLAANLQEVDGRAVLQDIRNINRQIIKRLGVTIKVQQLIGISFHMAFMLDRLKMKLSSEPFAQKAEFIHTYADAFREVKAVLQTLEDKYAVTIPEDEVCYMLVYFLQLK